MSKSSAVAVAAKARFIALSAIVGAQHLAGTTALTVRDASLKALHNEGAKPGRFNMVLAKCCPLIAAFIGERFPGGLNAKGEPIAVSSRNNAVSAFTKSVRDGVPYSENNARKSGGGNFMLAISAKDTDVTAAGKIRNLCNKIKTESSNDELIALVAYIVDALDENGFEVEAE
jgi:hypothetical protein